MPKGFNKEVKRQGFHLTLGLVLAFAVQTLGYAFSVYALAGILGIGLVLMTKTDKGVIEKFIKVFGREHETEAQGAFYFFLGAFISLFLFYDKAVPAILVLGVSDAASTLAGKLFPKKIIFGEKTFAGSSAFLITCTAILLFFTNPVAAVTTSFMITLVELFRFGIDDNVTIPVATGFMLFLIG